MRKPSGKNTATRFLFEQYTRIKRQGNAVVGAVRLSGLGDPTRAVDQFLPEE